LVFKELTGSLYLKFSNDLKIVRDRETGTGTDHVKVDYVIVSIDIVPAPEESP